MALNKIVIEESVRRLDRNLQVFIYNSIDSTNTRAKIAAEQKECGNAVFIANEQTAGRGRMGRRFFSSTGKGLYLSILVNERMPVTSGINVTTYMAVIAARAIERLTGLDTRIKWVNDIYVNGKKLAGILTEGKIDSGDNTLLYSVCGIGINILKQEFPPEIAGTATSIEDESGTSIDVNALASEIINGFFEGLSLLGTKEIAEEYKSRSFLIGKRVRVIRHSDEYDADVLDITDECKLLVRRENGDKEYLSTGEVSIKT